MRATCYGMTCDYGSIKNSIDILIYINYVRDVFRKVISVLLISQILEK